MKIFLVDDSKTMRSIQMKCLEDVSTDFAEASDGMEALQRLGCKAGEFGLIMIDWNMPKMDGLSLVKEIRKFDTATPLIMCTTEAEKAQVVEAIKAGVNNYVIKPFTPDSMMDKVHATLARCSMSHGPKAKQPPEIAEPTEDPEASPAAEAA